MASGLFIWSKTASSNATADSSINWSEGQSPSSVNDSARAMMARMAEYRDDIAGALTTAGTSTAYTVTVNQQFDTLAHMSGHRITVRFHATNGASPTLNVTGASALGAKAIQTLSGTAVPTGAIRTDSIWELVYDNSASAWILIGVPHANFLASNTVAISSLAFSASQRLAGRYTSGAGAGEEISLGTGILLSGAGVLSAASSQGVQIINGTITEANATNAVTFALKTLAGSDPSASDPVYVVFRNATAGTGNYVVRTVTSATSLTISAGSNLGVSTNNEPFNVWLVLFDDAGTVRLGAVNCLNHSTLSIFKLRQFPLASSTAEGGAGAADSAHVFYTGTAVASKAFVVAAKAYYASGLATAGNWNVSPDRIELYTPGMALPGEVVQVVDAQTGAAATGTTVIPNDDVAPPQNTEGDQYLTASITPNNEAHLLHHEIKAQLTNSVGGSNAIGIALFQDSTADALAYGDGSMFQSGAHTKAAIDWKMMAGTTSSTTFNVRGGSADAGTTTFNGQAGGRRYAGVYNSTQRITEIAA